MCSPEDIKPTVAGDSTLHPDPSRLPDIKPFISNNSTINAPIDLTTQRHSIHQERCRLEEDFRLRKTVLDLQEENLQLREQISRPNADQGVAKVEPREEDTKPDISGLRAGCKGRSNELVGPPLDSVESDDDDIVFLREVKGGGHRLGDKNEFPIPPSSREATPSGPKDGALSTHSLSMNTPATLAKTDHVTVSYLSPCDAVYGQIEPTIAEQTIHQEQDQSSTTTVARRDSRSSSPSDSDSESDMLWDPSFTAPMPSNLPLYDGPAKRERPTYQARSEARKAKRQELEGQEMYGTTFAHARSFKRDDTGPTKPPHQLTSGSNVPTKDTERATGTDDRLEPSASTDDEGRAPYRGPRLKVLSVKALNDRLDRSIGKWGISYSGISDWSSWWPKTKVANYHTLDAARVYLLTWSVHVWWSKLYTEVNSPKYDWPEGMCSISKEILISRVEEISSHKKGDAVRGEREMISSGRKITPDSVIRLDG